MTIFAVVDKGLLSRFGTSTGDYVIYFGDKIVYPPGGRGGAIDLSQRTGTTFVPYANFVSGNGEYDVQVRYAGTEARARVTVEKWVRYVYLHPYEKDGEIIVESALQSASGGSVDDRILARGDLILSLKFHGKDGSLDENVDQFHTTTENDAVGNRLEIAKGRFDRGPGFYSFEPLFHNLEARDNVQVKGDPAMANSVPPLNWILIN
jgi:hypothetical protein